MSTRSGKVYSNNSNNSEQQVSYTSYYTMASGDRDRPLFRAGISSPEVFILKLKAYSKRHNIADDTLLQEISLYLDDNANNWLMSLSDDELRTVAAFKDQLLQRYSLTTDKFSAMEELKNRKHMPGQDALQFVDDLSNLYHKCELDSKQIVPFCVAALENNLRVYVRAQNPKTMQDVRTAITRYTGATARPPTDQHQYAVVDALCSRLDTVVQQLTNVASVQTPSHPNNRRQHSNQSRTPKQRQQPTQRNNSKDCFFCGGKFHPQLADCPARGKICNNCGKDNHFAKVCRAKKA